MKTWLPLIVLAVLGGLAQPALSQQVWLLADYQGERSVLQTIDGAREQKAGFRKISPVGAQALYGASDRAIAVLSYNTARQSFILDVIDRGSGAVTSWPVTSGPVSNVSGPFQNLLLTKDFAYYPSMRNLEQEGANTKGGAFELSQVSLADGQLRTFPLPPHCVDPRLVLNEGTPLVYSWNQNGIWQLDPATQRLHQIVSRGDLADRLNEEAKAEYARRVPDGALTDYVFVPSHGAYRLSRLGRIEQILTAHLQHPPRSASNPLSIDIGPANNVLQLLAGTYRGRPSIQLITKKGNTPVLSYIIPETLRTAATVELSVGAIAESLTTTTDGNVAYIDRTSGAINIVSPVGTTTVATLDPKPQIIFARLIHVGDVPSVAAPQ